MLNDLSMGISYFFYLPNMPLLFDLTNMPLRQFAYILMFTIWLQFKLYSMIFYLNTNTNTNTNTIMSYKH